MPESKTIVMTHDKNCKHSVRYKAPDGVKDPIIQNLYLMNSFAGGNQKAMPEQIKVTVTAE